VYILVLALPFGCSRNGEACFTRDGNTQKEIDRLKADLASANKRLDAIEHPPPPPDAEQLQKLRKATEDALDARVRKERAAKGVDRGATEQATERLKAIFKDAERQANDDKTPLPKGAGELKAIECFATICRVETEHPANADKAYRKDIAYVLFKQALFDVDGWRGWLSVGHVERQPSGAVRQLLYMGKEPPKSAL